MGMTEYFGTGTKKGRGMAQPSLDLIDAMRVITEATQPITAGASATSCEQRVGPDVLTETTKSNPCL